MNGIVPDYVFNYAVGSLKEAQGRINALPESRERSIANTKVDEAILWVEKLQKDNKADD